MSPTETEDHQKITAIFPADTVEAGRASSRPPASSGSKTPLLPDLSTSTREILARVQAGDTSPAVGGASSPAFASKAAAMQGVGASERTTDATAHFRPSIGTGIFDKSKLKSAFASALIPKSKALPPQPVNDTTTTSSSVAPIAPSSASTSHSEKPPQPDMELRKLAPAPAPSSTKPDESTIEVKSSAAKSSPVDITPAEEPSTSQPDAEKPETPKLRKKASHTYVLPNGEIVNSGKGLGRGRPGIKRGPRKPKSTSNLSEPKSASRKRKRSLAESDVDHDHDHDHTSHSPPHSISDSGDEYAPQATQTRSGRHTQRPANFVPPESPSDKKSRLDSSADVGVTKLPIKRRAYKGREQSALCEHCLRGYGPLKNAIVFCDGCNRCWHQRCHDPMIARKLILDPSSEWFCNECAALNDKAKSRRAVRVQKQAEADTTAATAVATTPAAAEKSTVAPPLSSADVVSARKDYCNSLPKEKLVNLLMQASELIPDHALSQLLPVPTPLAPPPPPPPHLPPQVQPPNRAPSSAKEDAYPTPTNELSDDIGDGDGEKEDQIVDNGNDDGEDEFEYEDEHKKLYPKPGNGVPLPPESEDLDMLLEGPDCGTFSHMLGDRLAVGVH